MKNKKRLTITVDEIALDQINEIVREKNIKISFLINYLMTDFLEMYHNNEGDNNE